MRTVYLGGSISPAPEHMVWRTIVKEWADGINPFRKGIKDILLAARRCNVIDPVSRQSPEHFTPDGLHDSATPDAVFVRADIADIIKSDVVMCVYWKREIHFTSNSALNVYNDAVLNGYRRQSIGTWAEFGLAAYLNKPIVVVSDDESVRDHPFVKVLAAASVGTIEEACKVMEKLI